MNCTILPNGRLRISCDAGEQKNLQDIRTDDSAFAPGHGWGTSHLECEMLEHLVCNSELEWIDPSMTGDLTSAPMLGILGEEVPYHHDDAIPHVVTGPNLIQPIIARWAWMDYAVRSFLDELAERGECEWLGGYFDSTKGK